MVSLSARARRYREIAEAMIAEQGGAEKCGEGCQQLIRRFAATAVLAEQIEAELLRGDRVDIKAYALLASTLVRISQLIVIDRPAKKNTPSLREYLSAKTTEKGVTE